LIFNYIFDIILNINYNYQNGKTLIMLLNSSWITYTTGTNNSADDKYGNPSAYFRKEFCLKTGIRKAVLSMSALGVYKVYINGKEVYDDFLSPGWVDYSKKLPLIRYDVTDMLCEHNAAGVILSDGWAVGHLGSNYAFKRCGYTDKAEFTFVLRLSMWTEVLNVLCRTAAGRHMTELYAEAIFIWVNTST